MHFCEHDNIEIAYKCLDCQEQEWMDEDERFALYGEPVDEYWPEKIDALEVL